MKKIEDGGAGAMFSLQFQCYPLSNLGGLNRFNGDSRGVMPRAARVLASMGVLRSMRLYKRVRARARSLLGFPVFSSVLIRALALEMLELVLVSVSLCSRAKTWSGCLSFFFRFGLWKKSKKKIGGYQGEIDIFFIHLINHFK